MGEIVVGAGYGARDRLPPELLLQQALLPLDVQVHDLFTIRLI